MSEKNFPSTILGLSSYLKTAMLWLEANATRLGITAAQIDALKDIYGDDATLNTYLYWLNQWNTTPARKDSRITTNLADFSEKMKVKLMEVYGDIPDSTWTNDDRTMLKRKTGLPHVVTRPEVAIAAPCHITIEAKGNAVLNGGARADISAKKFSMPESAKQLEIRYAVIQGKFPIPAEMADKVKKTCLGPDDGTTTIMSPKSTFTIKLDVMYKGYDLICWGRWIDISYPEFAGNFGDPQTKTIV